MIYIFIFLILLPILAICKIIAKKIGVETLLVVSYILTWSIGLFLYFVGVVHNWWSVLLAPFISQISFKFALFILKWTFKTISESD